MIFKLATLVKIDKNYQSFSLSSMKAFLILLMFLVGGQDLSNAYAKTKKTKISKVQNKKQKQNKKKNKKRSKRKKNSGLDLKAITTNSPIVKNLNNGENDFEKSK